MKVESIDKPLVEFVIETLNLFEKANYESYQYELLLDLNSMCRDYIELNNVCNDIMQYVSKSELCKLISYELKHSAELCLYDESFSIDSELCGDFFVSYSMMWESCIACANALNTII